MLEYLSKAYPVAFAIVFALTTIAAAILGLNVLVRLPDWVARIRSDFRVGLKNYLGILTYEADLIQEIATLRSMVTDGQDASRGLRDVVWDDRSAVNRLQVQRTSMKVELEALQVLTQDLKEGLQAMTPPTLKDSEGQVIKKGEPVYFDFDFERGPLLRTGRIPCKDSIGNGRIPMLTKVESMAQPDLPYLTAKECASNLLGNNHPVQSYNQRVANCARGRSKFYDVDFATLEWRSLTPIIRDMLRKDPNTFQHLYGGDK